ncbi:hypothetical protein D0T92_05325 [Neisseria zalophi]|uniref:Colicin E3-like ribonuclease domain-containing protein n=1 Tax=Neisseria zalophi TaxID=640030 RepID=A0A5J6Q2N1_9NEIS|nr:hypothetical protein D0T92_05325 [Neisseria zalophi]
MGNLIHSSDQRCGVTKFEYDTLCKITKADKEIFAFDPAHNNLSDNLKDKIADNRLKTYNGISYYYDDLDNLIHRELADGEKYNKKGKHLGAFDPITGNQIKGLLKLGEFNHEKIHKIYIKI